MRFSIASDHAGYDMKEAVKKHLTAAGHEVVDFGTGSTESTDYPDYGAPAARAVASGDVDAGILLCGSGQGMSMVANKVHGIRAALAWSPEIARLSREHNDANVLVLPSRYVGADEALEIVDAWLGAGFDGGRHVPRVEKMMEVEED
jgi:ribose 5-phosphate isomerase B